MSSMFSDQEKEDLIRVMDEHLEIIHEDYADGEDSYRAYIERLAVLFYVFTGEDWQSATGIHLTEGGQLG